MASCSLGWRMRLVLLRLGDEKRKGKMGNRWGHVRCSDCGKDGIWERRASMSKGR